MQIVLALTKALMFAGAQLALVLGVIWLLGRAAQIVGDQRQSHQ
jgi:hypothetical protein